MSESEITSDVAALTVQLLSAYLANNTVASDDLAGLIRLTKEALTAETATSPVEPEIETFTPAVSVRKSLASPEHIISLIDGKPYKTLKRHLTGKRLTPDEYRARYGLPADYPMVASAYSALRRNVAQKLGLGRKAAPTAQAGHEATSATDPIDPEASPLVAAPKATKRHPKAAAAKAEVSARKAKATTADKHKVQEETPADASSGSETTPGGGTVASKASPIASPRKAKKATNDKVVKSPAATDITIEAGNVGATATLSDSVSEQQRAGGATQEAKPKRRRKIGLSSKREAQVTSPSGDAEMATITASDAAEPQHTNEAPSGARPSTKSSRPKRMARSSKPTAGHAPEAGGSEGAD